MASAFAYVKVFMGQDKALDVYGVFDQEEWVQKLKTEAGGGDGDVGNSLTEVQSAQPYDISLENLDSNKTTKGLSSPMG